MKTKSIKVNQRYRAVVNKNKVTVEVLDEHPQGGWIVKNLNTNRKLRIINADRFLDPAPPKKQEVDPKGNPVKPKKPTLQERLAQKVENGDANTLSHCVVMALAGTGKTFTLIMGVAFVFLFQNKKLWQQVVDHVGFEPTPSPEQLKVWTELGKSKSAKTVTYCAFNKSIVTEFGEKWGKLVDILSGVGITLSFSTVNALGYASVRGAFGYVKPTSWHTKNILQEVKGMDLREMMKHHGVLVNAVDSLTSLSKLTLVGWEKGRPFDPNNITDKEFDDLVHHYDIELADRDETYDLTRRVLAESLRVGKYREIDFDDQNWLPVVLDLPVQKHDVLMVDEAQDLPRCKQEFAIKAGRRLFVVGDVNQAIYGFAGADVDSIPRMLELLDVSDPKYLTETRRCGHKIVAKANETLRQCYRHRKEDPVEFLAHESNPEGEVRRVSIEQYVQEVKDGDMVLCRVNAPLVSQALRLIKDGRKAIIRGRDFGQSLINFVKKMKASDVGDLLEKVSDWYQKEAQKESRKRNPSEAKLISLEDRKNCVEAFCEDVQTVDEVIQKLQLVFAGKVCPKCGKHFGEELERCPIKSCRSEVDPVTGWRVGPRLVTPEGVTFSSIHRAKGLEADRVYILYKDAPIPHPMARSEWAVGQEWNCKYIAESRGIRELIEVT